MLFTFRKSGTSFPAKTQGFWYLSHSYILLCTVFLCVFRQLDSIRLSSKSFILYIIRLCSHSAYHTQVWNIKDLPSCSLVRYDYKYDSVYTPTEIRAVKYKYQKTIYFLSAFQQYIASLALKYSTYCNMVTTLTTIHPTVNRFISSPSP